MFCSCFYQHFKKYRLSLAQTRLMSALLPPSSAPVDLRTNSICQQLLPQPTTIALQARINFTLSPWESALIGKSFFVCAQYFFYCSLSCATFPPADEIQRGSLRFLSWRKATEAYPSLGDRLLRPRCKDLTLNCLNKRHAVQPVGSLELGSSSARCYGKWGEEVGIDTDCSMCIVHTCIFPCGAQQWGSVLLRN